MRISHWLIAVALCLPVTSAWADEDTDQPETIVVRDLMSGGTRTVRPDWEEINKHPLGSAGNPVRCDYPQGQRAYLRRLKCPGGARPTFDRAGSAGKGPYETIMDIYNISCPEADEVELRSAYLDMYHPDYVEKRSLPGFTIDPPPPPGWE